MSVSQSFQNTHRSKGQRLLRAQIRSAVLFTVPNHGTCLGRIINDPVIVEIY